MGFLLSWRTLQDRRLTPKERVLWLAAAISAVHSGVLSRAVLGADRPDIETLSEVGLVKLEWGR